MQLQFNVIPFLAPANPVSFSTLPRDCIAWLRILISRWLNHTMKACGSGEKYIPQWKFYKEELTRLPVSHGEWSY
jgi:hypothetical protein